MVQRITTVRFATIHVHTVIRSHPVEAILLHPRSTRLAVTFAAQTGVTLGADTDTVTDLDAALSLGADPHSNADNLMANTAWV